MATIYGNSCTYENADNPTLSKAVVQRYKLFQSDNVTINPDVINNFTAEVLTKKLHDKYYTIHGYTAPVRFRIADKYDDAILGRGSGGTVIVAWDSLENREVAIKKINIAQYQSIKMIIRLFREIYLQKHLSHPNVISLTYCYGKSTLEPERWARSDEFYLVMPYIVHKRAKKVSTFSDLLKILKRGEGLSSYLSLNHIRRFMATLISGMAHFHKHGVVHRDLKPANVAFDKHFNATVLDLGLGRTMGDQGNHTAYVQTRPWRAPEVAWNTMDHLGNYTSKLDMWSIGVLLFELTTLQDMIPYERSETPLHSSYIAKFVKYTGVPDQQMWNILGPRIQQQWNQSLYQDILRTHPEYLRPGRDGLPYHVGALRSALERNPHVLNADTTLKETFFDFASKLLTLNPEQRGSAEEMLKHPFLAGERVVENKDIAIEKERPHGISLEESDNSDFREESDYWIETIKSVVKAYAKEFRTQTIESLSGPNMHLENMDLE